MGVSEAKFEVRPAPGAHSILSKSDGTVHSHTSEATQALVKEVRYYCCPVFWAEAPLQKNGGMPGTIVSVEPLNAQQAGDVCGYKFRCGYHSQPLPFDLLPCLSSVSGALYLVPSMRVCAVEATRVQLEDCVRLYRHFFFEVIRLLRWEAQRECPSLKRSMIAAACVKATAVARSAEEWNAQSFSAQVRGCAAMVAVIAATGEDAFLTAPHETREVDAAAVAWGERWSRMSASEMLDAVE